jgi:hypothetical protein
MPQRKYPRIEIDQLAYDGLQIEAVLQHTTPREIATKAILGYISEKALLAIDHTTYRPQDHKTIEGAAIESSGQKVDKMECKKEGEAIICAPKQMTPEARQALSFILSELESGREPTVNEVAVKVGITTNGLGRTLAVCGIKAKNTNRDNKTVRIFTKPMKAQIEEILSAKD